MWIHSSCFAATDSHARDRFRRPHPGVRAGREVPRRMAPRAPKPTSGLIEQQRVFGRARRP